MSAQILVICDADAETEYWYDNDQVELIVFDLGGSYDIACISDDDVPLLGEDLARISDLLARKDLAGSVRQGLEKLAGRLLRVGWTS